MARHHGDIVFPYVAENRDEFGGISIEVPHDNAQVILEATPPRDVTPFPSRLKLATFQAHRNGPLSVYVSRNHHSQLRDITQLVFVTRKS